MKITKTQLRQIIKEELSPEFADSMEMLMTAVLAQREVQDARITGKVNLDELDRLLKKLVDGLPKVLKPR
jgi:flagellar biosynthesis/type III secretory pathway protein FliH